MPTMPWDPGGLFNPTPAAAPATYSAPTPPPTGATPQQNAQYLVDSYLAWMGAGAPTAPDGKTPLGPGGQPATGIPTVTEFDAARNYLASTVGKTNSVVSAPATSRFIVKTDGTVTPNPNYAPPKPIGPTKTQAEIDQEAADAHNEAVAALNKVANPQATPQTPEQQALTQAQTQLTLANAAKAAATTPGEVAAAEAQVAKAQQDIQSAQTLLPGQVAQQGAQTAGTQAATTETQARTDLVNLQAQQAKENDPLVKAQLQAQIDNLNSQIADRSKPPPPTGIAADTTAPFILQNVYNPDTKQWELKQTPNTNQQMTSTDAIRQLAQQVGMNLGDGPNQIPLQQAKDLITMAKATYDSQTSRMSADTSQQNADTATGQLGAGVLQSRASNATSMLNNAVGAAAGNKNFGLGGAIPGDMGANLMGDALGFSGQAVGGQNVLDTATQLIHQAAPALAKTPAGAGYAAVLAQMLQPSAPPQSGAPAGGAPPAPASPPPFAQSGMPEGGSRGFPAPVTQIAPDGTITVQHTGPSPFVQSGISEGTDRMAFQAPVSTL